MAVLGTGRVKFSLWEIVHQDVRVTVMATLPSKFLIGRRFTMQYGMQLVFTSGFGTYSVPTSRRAVRFSGYGLSDTSKSSTDFEEAMHEPDFDDAVDAMSLSEFGTGEEECKLLEPRRDFGDYFSPTTSTAPGREFPIELEERADLKVLNRMFFTLSRTETELEALEVRTIVDRGILMQSTSPHGTNNEMVSKKKLLDGSPGGMRVTLDFRAFNPVTKSMAYPTKDVKKIVIWLASKRFYFVADLKDWYWNQKLRKATGI